VIVSWWQWPAWMPASCLKIEIPFTVLYRRLHHRADVPKLYARRSRSSAELANIMFAQTIVDRSVLLGALLLADMSLGL